ncbi:MAG: SDR family oxidoreductase [Christensenellaceae bacterium]|nr:SDR family oxidoreductase [Christensenellaceae bacterium]
MKVVVITGGSGGIGLALCREFCAQGDKVYSLSRTHNTENPAVHITADVSDNASVKAAFAQIEEDHIDLLINNAGFGISGAIEFTEVGEAERQFQVNFFGGLRCTQAALPMLRKCRGRIINVSSAAAIFSIPFQAFYSASKAAVNSLTLALRNELRDFGISVCAVMPGDVKTGFTKQRHKSNAGSELYQDKIEASIAVMERDEQNGMTPEYVARYIRRISDKRSVRPLYSAGFLYKIFYMLNKLLPQRLVNWIVSVMYIKKKK